MKRGYLITLFIVIIMGILFFWQWQNGKQHRENKENLNASLLFDNFVALSKQFNSIEETLEMYREDFNDREKKLFRNSLRKDIVSLNRIGINLEKFRVKESLKYRFYTQHLYKIENTVSDIVQGEITKEEKIRKISNILGKYGQRLSDMIFIEHIGQSGMYKQEILDRIMHIISNINKEISAECS
ncbi:MAG: hypothetical protein FH753_16960 [Firmicutes bacterium]|nr:hypothetical protein [Bacillota bacterium]